MLRPADLYICLFLASRPDSVGYEALAGQLKTSVGSAHNSLKRLKQSGLMVFEWEVNRKSLLEFVAYGCRYVYYVKPGAIMRGIPTADAAPPLVTHVSAAEFPYVWPDPEGTVRGTSIEPLHKSAPRVALSNERFYQLLAVTDAIRVGQARVRELAKIELGRLLA